jgi:hypothetical protein
MVFTILLKVFLCFTSIAHALPEKWWENTKGLNIENAEHLE